MAEQTTDRMESLKRFFRRIRQRRITRMRRHPLVPIATDTELSRFVRAADRLGQPSIGTAALLSRKWHLRPTTSACLDARQYRSGNAKDSVVVENAKAGQGERLSLYKLDGTPLFPQLVARLDRAKGNRTTGPLVFRDHVLRNTGKIVPWVTRGDLDVNFHKMVRAILIAAGLPPSFTIVSFRADDRISRIDKDLHSPELLHFRRHKNEPVLRRYVAPGAVRSAKRDRRRCRR
jgi:hypothetical protein